MDLRSLMEVILNFVSEGKGDEAVLEQFFHDNLVFLNQEYKDFEDVLSHVMKALINENYVEKDFEEALLMREKEFPTGLQLDGYAVAIPHGGSQYVKKDFISLVTLKNPIFMNRMDNPEESLAIDILFIIGFGESDTHLQCLKQLMGLIQNPKAIEELKKGTSIMSII